MTRSASCPTASGSSKMHWQRHMPCIAVKGIPFCRTNYCKSNVPWSENPGTKCLLHRRPKPRKPSTLWDLCKCEEKTTLRFCTHSHSFTPSAISDTGRTNFYGQTANSYVGSFLQVRFRPSFKFLFHPVSPTGQTPCSSDGRADLTYCFVSRTKLVAKRRMTSPRLALSSCRCPTLCLGGAMHSLLLRTLLGMWKRFAICS